MTFSPQVQKLIDDWNEASIDFGPLLRGEPGDWAAARAKYLSALTVHPAPPGVRIEETDMGGIPATTVTPEEAECGRTLLFIHGGGYVAGSPAGYHGLAGNLAKLLSAKVFMPDYRLAPEHPFPAAVDDVTASFSWLLDQGIESRSIAFAGDSAGGAMVVSAMVSAKAKGLPLPFAGVAMSPWANLEHTGSSMRTRDGIDPTVNPIGLELMGRTYLGGALPNSPEASPVFADVRGLPPILIQIGEREIMLSDAIRLATHLAENEVRMSLEVWPGMFHVWHMFSHALREGRQALEGAAHFIDKAWETT